MSEKIGEGSVPLLLAVGITGLGGVLPLAA